MQCLDEPTSDPLALRIVHFSRMRKTNQKEFREETLVKKRVRNMRLFTISLVRDSPAAGADFPQPTSVTLDRFDFFTCELLG